MNHEDDSFVPAAEVSLSDDPTGDTIATISGRRYVIGQIMSACPITNKYQYVSIRDEHGAEIAIVEGARSLEGESRRILKRELEHAYFLPKITDIYRIDDHLNLFTFSVDTNRGPRTFEVRNPRQNVRSVGGGRYIIKDVDGNRYEIAALQNLGLRSQNLMTEFV